MVDVSVRRAKRKDLFTITAIYNDAIRTSISTFDTEERTIKAQREWFESHGPMRPLLVAESDGRVIGWTALSDWSDRDGYVETVELSLYVLEKYRGRGVGTELMRAILDAAASDAVNIHTIIAMITEGNARSVRLHEKFGFRSIGRMREVGEKFGRRLDVVLMQKMVENSHWPKSERSRDQ